MVFLMLGSQYVRSVTGLFVVQVLILKRICTNQLSFPMPGDRIVALLIPSARESYFVTIGQGFVAMKNRADPILHFGIRWPNLKIQKW
jgi:hypothetical protein